MAERVTWTNEKRRLGDLLPWPRNPRTIKNAQAERLVDSVETFGQVETLAIGPGNEIYNGHQRLSVLRGEYGADYEVDVRVASRALTEKEREKLTIYLHKGAAGEWDFDTLANEFEMDDLLAWGFEPFELGLSEMDDDGPVGEDPGADVSKADELQAVWQVQLGDLWQLGDHRLICGDCTDEATVQRVMGGELFDLCITSPPYNSGNGGYKTDYNGKTKKFYQDDTDDRTEDEWVDFCETVLRTCGKFTRNDSSAVVWNVMYTARCRSGYGRSLFGGRQPFTVKETICWDKGAGFPTASKGILSRNWELVFVLSKGEKYNTTQGDNEPRWAKWDISRPTEQDESHKATYPVDLPIKAIQDFSYDDAIVYEPFSGSGTTIIACEQLGRKCRAVELHPPYVAVALQRWADMTGKTPVRIESAI